MTRQSLIDRIVDEGYYLQKNMLKECLDKFLDTMSDALVEGEHIELRGFGTWTPEITKPRKVATFARDEFGRARLTDKKRLMPPRRWIKFRIARELKNKLAQKGVPGQPAVKEEPL